VHSRHVQQVRDHPASGVFDAVHRHLLPFSQWQIESAGAIEYGACSPLDRLRLLRTNRNLTLFIVPEVHGSIEAGVRVRAMLRVPPHWAPVSRTSSWRVGAEAYPSTPNCLSNHKFPTPKVVQAEATHHCDHNYELRYNGLPAIFY